MMMGNRDMGAGGTMTGHGDYSHNGSGRLSAGKRERDRGSSRSQSRSRSRERHRRRHSSRKHRRRHSRSRSRSRGAHGKVHINPLFSGGLGPSATSLLQENTRLEHDVTRLRAEMTCNTARVTVLENELRNAVHARNRAEQQLTTQGNEKRKLETRVTDMTQNLNRLERMMVGMRADVVRANAEKEKFFEASKVAEMERNSVHEQNEFLSKRNETLGKKCSELLEKNRQFKEESEEAYRTAAGVRREMENLQASTDMRMAEFRRMQNELSAAREKEKMWTTERGELEKRLEAKESLLHFDRRQSEIQRKRDKEQIARLEQKLKSDGTGWETQLGIESVFRAIEVVKSEFGAQLTELKGEVGPLLEKTSEGVSFRPLPLAGLPHPPRTASAPAAPARQYGTPDMAGTIPTSMASVSTVLEVAEMPNQESSTPAVDKPVISRSSSCNDRKDFNMDITVKENADHVEHAPNSVDMEEKAAPTVKTEVQSDCGTEDLLLEDSDALNCPSSPHSVIVLDEDALLGPA